MSETYEVEACPECDSTQIKRRRRSTFDQPAYHCEDCGSDFDEPKVRESVNGKQGISPSNGMAADLWKRGQEGDD